LEGTVTEFFGKLVEAGEIKKNRFNFSIDTGLAPQKYTSPELAY